MHYLTGYVKSLHGFEHADFTILILLFYNMSQYLYGRDFWEEVHLQMDSFIYHKKSLIWSFDFEL